MTRGKANTIVNDFFKDMNPSYWNGEGEQPKDFDGKIWECNLTDKFNLEITLQHNGVDGWCHYCDIVPKNSGDSIDALSGYGIDSPLNLADTIMDLCREY